MKKLLLAMIAVAALISFAACDHNETYADQRDRELDSINAFLRISKSSKRPSLKNVSKPVRLVTRRSS